MMAALVVGANRGLGLALTQHLCRQPSISSVFATSRSQPKNPFTSGVTTITNVDLLHPSDAAKTIANGIDKNLSYVFITAGVFTTDTLDDPDPEAQIKMYTISAIAPTNIISELKRGRKLDEGCKVFLISSESGSVTLRHAKEGGGNYGHHASKAAVNMVGKLLSLDLKDDGVAVCVVHPGFMRTEMTKNVGFDKFWEEGGAVTPEEAAESLWKFAENFSMDSTGEFWAPRGAGDIGTAKEALGNKEFPIPFRIPY